MQVQVKLKNGIIASIHNVMWHPEFTAHLEPGIGTPMPAGCWVRKSTVAKFVVGTVRERSVRLLSISSSRALSSQRCLLRSWMMSTMSLGATSETV